MPMFVLDDADVAMAARAAWFGATLNRGQTCIAVRRAFVHRSVYQAFCDLLKSDGIDRGPGEAGPGVAGTTGGATGAGGLGRRRPIACPHRAAERRPRLFMPAVIVDARRTRPCAARLPSPRSWA